VITTVATTSKTKVAETIRACQENLLESYRDTLIFGLGVNDPKRVFGTTTGLVERFGGNRVFETPTAENSSMGIAVGLAISGFKPIVVHQRLDFFLLAMDQLVNSAAKWRFMFGDAYDTAIVIRLIVGRGWGQGPTHSQNLHAWFTHIPGLRVFFPTFADDFKTIFDHAFNQKFPVVLIEDRWVHSTEQSVMKTKVKFGEARLLSQGGDLSLITFGFNTILGMQVSEFYKKLGIQIDHIDLVSLKPIDFEKIFNSVAKTGRLVIIDSGFEISSLGSYISHEVNKRFFKELKSPIEVLTAGDFPETTSHGIIGSLKISAESIARVIQRNLKLDSVANFQELKPKFVDVPDERFKGPF
jgi:pyruvate/2-oxoglutarate/acetoin dehydrogenase E1 component